MCGACPARGPSSTVTGYLSLHGGLAEFDRAVSGRLAGRATLSRFGEYWALRDRLGSTQLLRSAEELVAAVRRLSGSERAAADPVAQQRAAAGLRALRGQRLRDLGAEVSPSTLCGWLFDAEE